jgi:hypothetical protein
MTPIGFHKPLYILPFDHRGDGSVRFDRRDYAGLIGS